ncbi:MAG: outer membrane protein assembly factor BamB [Gammaproteobacteria bacterium]|nr:outer membrane protein assembly factor BamB [Gammaproteobacteria bacterium]
MTVICRLSILLLACAFIGGCGVFGGKDDELPPKELTDFKATLDVRKAWSAKLGKGSELLRINLMPAGDGKRVYAASIDGNVSAYEPESGKLLWRSKLGISLSAGPGTGRGLVIVAGADGEIVALRSETGNEAWRSKVLGESLSVPLVKDGEVIVYTIDGRLHSLSSTDGSENWVVEQPLPPLTLRGASTPQIVGNRVIAGFDNGRLVAVSLAEGVTEWEAMLSPPSGRSDLERLADVDGSIAAVGQDIYAAGYQGRVASLAVESGQILWAREISTSAGIAADWNNVYIVADGGELIALLRSNGSDVWRTDALLRRQPTTPVPFNTAVVVGDLEGYLHFFSNADGGPVARMRAGNALLSGSPVVIGTRLFVQSEDGSLYAFEVAQPRRPGNSKDTAAEKR